MKPKIKRKMESSYKNWHYTASRAKKNKLSTTFTISVSALRIVGEGQGVEISFGDESGKRIIFYLNAQDKSFLLQQLQRLAKEAT